MVLLLITHENANFWGHSVMDLLVRVNKTMVGAAPTMFPATNTERLAAKKTVTVAKTAVVVTGKLVTIAKTKLDATRTMACGKKTKVPAFPTEAIVAILFLRITKTEVSATKTELIAAS